IRGCTGASRVQFYPRGVAPPFRQRSHSDSSRSIFSRRGSRQEIALHLRSVTRGLIFMTRGERLPRSWEFYPGARRNTALSETWNVRNDWLFHKFKLSELN